MAFGLHGGQRGQIIWDQASVKATNIHANTAEIQWDPVTTEPKNDHDITFTVTTTPGKATCSVVHAANSDLTEGNHCQLNGLTENTDYQIRVVPSTAGYQDGAPGQVEFYTPRSVLPKIQWDTHALHADGNTTKHQVKVSWNPVVNTPNNENIVFHVSMTPSVETCTVVHAPSDLPTENNTCVLGQLKNDTEAFARIK